MSNPFNLSARDGPPSGSMWIWSVVEGALLMALGALAAALPIAAGLAAALVFGWMLLLSGLIGLAGLVMSRGWIHPTWGAVSAGVAVLAGAAVLFAPMAGVFTLAVLIAAYLAVDGAASIATALDHRRRSARGWLWVLGTGLVNLLLALAILVLGPKAEAVVIGVIVAIDLLIGGVSLIGLGLALRR